MVAFDHMEMYEGGGDALLALAKVEALQSLTS